MKMEGKWFGKKEALDSESAERAAKLERGIKAESGGGSRKRKKRGVEGPEEVSQMNHEDIRGRAAIFGGCAKGKVEDREKEGRPKRWE